MNCAASSTRRRGRAATAHATAHSDHGKLAHSHLRRRSCPRASHHHLLHLLFLAVALAGYLVRLPDLSAPLRAAANLSFPRWAYQAAVLHEFKGRDDLLGGPRYEAALLATYGFDEASLADCVLAQVALLAALLLLHLLALTRLNWDGR